ncbi:MAG: response regulator transcription factor [Crocinitomicaceae bacterium]|nr:response regulator transcription factor [Crocinitomicaceae bacterium]
MTNYSILIVDDEPDILQFLTYNLNKEGYKVYTAQNGEEGLKKTFTLEPSLVLMDVMMPIMDGIETCQLIRENKSITQPIICFLTSRGEDYSQIAGFQAGADDYVTKPIRPRLLISKVKSLLRRYTTVETKENSSSIKIDRDRYTIELKGKNINLPKKEFQLLDFLVSRPGKVFSRDQIMSYVWGTETIVGERTVDVHIRKIREKLGNDYIRTIKGVGYTYNEI